MRWFHDLFDVERLFALISMVVTFGTFWVATRNFWRNRNSRTFDIFALAFLYFGAQYGFGRHIWGFIVPHRVIGGVLFTALVPYFHLRLAAHHSKTIKWLEYLTLAVGLGWCLTAVPPIQELRVPREIRNAFTGYVLLIEGYVTWLFYTQMQRSQGVTRKRFRYATASTIFYPLSNVSEVVLRLFGAESITLSNWHKIFQHLSTLMTFMVIAPPRRITQRWQRNEVLRYIHETSNREALDRGQQAGADLLRAASRSVAHSAVFVALRDAQASGVLTVRAASPDNLVGLIITDPDRPEAALARADQDGAPSVIEMTDVAADVREKLQTLGDSILVTPIVTPTRRWGLLGVVKEKGSLFPDDDLRLLAEITHYAGGILDHAQLVVEAEARERETAEQRLREVESRMALMLDNITDHAIFIVDARGSVVNWPIGAETVFGRTAEGIVDHSAGPLFGMSELDFVGVLKDVAQQGRMTREDECQRKDGARFVGSTYIRPIAPGRDALTGFVVVTRDMTERHAMEERLRQGQKMEALGRLAGGIAHDFNNLLTAILGYADWLSAELPEDDTARRQQVGEIQKAAERAAGLTRQLLAFSRQQVAQLAPLNVPLTISDLLPMLRRIIGEHITIVEESVGGAPLILGDKNQLEQVVINLAVNARDAMPSGGRLVISTRPEVVTSATHAPDLRPGTWLRLDVRDTGIGMDEATRARIFEPFFTTKESGRGTGLGLATVYGIVTQLGGVIRSDSTPGEGTVFSVFIPAIPNPDHPVDAGEAAPEAARGSETILLVEDESSVRQLLTQILQRHGYQLLVAGNIDEARALADTRQDSISLLITDVVLPGGNGPELVRQLRQHQPHLPVLFISGYADGLLSDPSGLPSNAHFLQKPFSAIDLLIKVRQLLASPTP